jgi:predicted esterase
VKIKVSKTAQIAVYGEQDKANTLWLVLHGYGQLSAYFIRHFQTLDPQKNFVLSPEGLHRFYLNGTSGRVGASWMTKEQRLDDIADNCAYLNQLFAQFYQVHLHKRVVLLGFSQGAATAARWLAEGNGKVDAFVLWAGVFPPDVEWSNYQRRSQFISHYFVVGNQDTYFSEESVAQLQSEFKKKQLPFQLIQFEGKHEIQQESLLKLEKKIHSSSPEENNL